MTAAVQSLLDEAVAAHRRGWVLTPLNGKIPRLSRWTERDPPSEQDVSQWAASSNVGVRTGAISGIVVIDDDTEDQSAARDLGLPDTVTAITGSGGLHHYFRCPAGGLRNSAGKLAASVDVRGDGGQVVLPGSVHPDTGDIYRWVEGRSPDEIDLAEFPAQLLERLSRDPQSTRVRERTDPKLAERLRRYAQGALTRAAGEIQSAVPGTRNDTLNRCAFAMGRFVGAGLLAEVEVEAALLAAARGAGLGDLESHKTFASGISAGREEPFDPSVLLADDTASPVPDDTATFRLTDYGNAERLVDRSGADLRYCHPWEKWMCWDGKHWGLDDTGVVTRAAKKTVRAIRQEAVACSDADIREAIWKHAKNSEKADRLRAMVKLAQSEPEIPILPDQLDRHPMLLNCRNGVLDLESGKLRKHERCLYITKVLPVDYAAEAACCQWEAFLRRVIPDADVRDYLQRAVGYSLTGLVGEQVLFFAHGEGANGKSVFLSAIQSVLGPYAMQLDNEVLLAKKSSSHPTEKADLFGARFVASTEIEQGRQLNESLVKQLTGGDRIRARRMKENFWEFEPTHKLWLAANHRPVIRGTDYAIWRRLHIIPFTVTIPKAERDKHLGRKLRSEASGILSWATRGCLAWQRDGLEPPAAVLSAVEEYRAESDTVGRFIEDRCVVGGPGRETASVLYAAFRDWCSNMGEEPISQCAFGTSLRARGLSSTKTQGRKVYPGCALRACKRG